MRAVAGVGGSFSHLCGEIFLHPAAAAVLLQSCLTLCDPIDGSPPGSAVPGILQARTLEWAAISFSNTWKWKVKVTPLSCVWLFATPWTVTYQAPPSMGFSRQEYWSGLPLPSPWVSVTWWKAVSSHWVVADPQTGSLELPGHMKSHFILFFHHRTNQNPDLETWLRFFGLAMSTGPSMWKMIVWFTWLPQVRVDTLLQASPTPGSWTNSGPWPVRNWAVQ